MSQEEINLRLLELSITIINHNYLVYDEEKDYVRALALTPEDIAIAFSTLKSFLIN